MKTTTFIPILFGALAVLSACTGGREDSIAANPRATEPELSFSFENFATTAEELPLARALLHSQDGHTVITDIDLHQTGGVARFGPQPTDSVHFSLVIGYEESLSVALSFNHLPVKAYVLRAPEYPTDLVSVDVDVDTSAMPGGAYSAGVLGFGHSYHLAWGNNAQSRWSFEDLIAAPQPGRIFAWATNQGGDESLYGEYRQPTLEDAGRYSVVTDRPVEPIMIDDMQAGTTVSGALILADQESGLWDSIDSQGPRQSLNLVAESADAAVDLYAQHPSTTEGFVWLTQEPRQAAPDRYSPAFWEVELEFDAWDDADHRQRFRYNAADPALLASSCTVISGANPEDELEFNVWCVATPASSGELHMPAMPADIAEKFDRNKVNSLEDGFEIVRFAQLPDYASWMDWWLEGAQHTPLWASYKRLEAHVESTGGSSICVTILAGFPICIPPPAATDTRAVPSVRFPSLLGIPHHQFGN